MLKLRIKLALGVLLLGGQMFEVLGLAGGAPKAPTPPPPPPGRVPVVPRVPGPAPVVGGSVVAAEYELVKGFIEGAHAPADILAAYKSIGETLGVIKAPCGNKVGDACSHKNKCCAGTGLECVAGACAVPEVPLPCSHVVGTACDARHTCCAEDSLVCGEKGACEKEVKLDEHCAKTIANLSGNPIAKSVAERGLQQAKIHGGLDYFADFTKEQQCLIKAAAQAVGQPYEDYALAQHYIKNRGQAPTVSDGSAAVAAPAPVVPAAARPAASGPALATAAPTAPVVARPAAVAATVAAPTPAAVAAAAAPTPSGDGAAVVLTAAQKAALDQQYGSSLAKTNTRIRALKAQASRTPLEQAELAYLES